LAVGGSKVLYNTELDLLDTCSTAESTALHHMEADNYEEIS